MRTVIVLAAFMLGFSCSAAAAPLCQVGTLANYVAMSGGCDVGNTTFTDFGAMPSFAGGAAVIDLTQVSVAPLSLPSGPQLAFLLSQTAGPNDLLGLAIAFTATSPAIVDATLDLLDASATGLGVVTVVEDLCLGGSFGADPTTCTGAAASLVVAADALGTVAPDQRSFGGPFSFFDVFVDITLDGFGGSASLGTSGAVVTRFTSAAPVAVPEPSALALVVAGAAGAWAFRRREN
jgi:hypothetical protein